MRIFTRGFLLHCLIDNLVNDISFIQFLFIKFNFLIKKYRYLGELNIAFKTYFTTIAINSNELSEKFYESISTQQ